MVTKPIPSTDLEVAQAEFLRTRRLLDRRVQKALYTECARAIERLKALGMDRPSIALLSQDGGALDGMTVIALDVACQRLRERDAESGNGAGPKAKAGAGKS